MTANLEHVRARVRIHRIRITRANFGARKHVRPFVVAFSRRLRSPSIILRIAADADRGVETAAPYYAIMGHNMI